MRFMFLVPSVMKPILWPFGASGDEAYVDIEGHSLQIRFGRLFKDAVDLGKVERAERSSWSFFYGLGVRIAGKGRLGVLASTDSVVRLVLREPVYLKVLFALAYPAKEVYLSLQDPERFLEQVNTAASESRSEP